MSTPLKAAGLLLYCGVFAPAYAQEHQHHQHHPTKPAMSEEKPKATTSGESEREHVPPDPPALEMHDMPYREMADIMGMDDTARYGQVLFDQLDWRDGDAGDLIAWNAQAWYGGDYNKLWLKTEGEYEDGIATEVRAEALWDRVVGRWWNLQGGVRHDFGEGPSRTWAAFGMQGLAPYFFEIEATAYVGASGRTAARFSGEYELLLTQRLILQPEMEFSIYGKSDPQNLIGSGLSDLQLGLRLRYEFRREFAPYFGLLWTRRFAETADLAQTAGEERNDAQVLMGVRFWF